jgi:hypothetical protein
MLLGESLFQLRRDATITDTGAGSRDRRMHRDR